MPQQSDAAKKSLEQWRLEQFRRQFTAFPAGSIIPSEEPDFLVRSGTLVVGIELTELYRDVPAGSAPPQVQEALRRRVTERAELLHSSSGLPPLHAFVHFSGVDLSKGRVEPLAQELARVVAAHVPRSGEVRRIENDYANPAKLPPELDTVSTYNLQGADRSFFSSPGATWMATLQSVDVDRALQSKNSRYPSYRAKCDEAWLIIGCNGEFMATWFEGVEAAASFKLTTPFERVFIMSYFDQKLVEL